MCFRDCGENIAKCLVITFNILCIILGGAAIGVGVWARVDSASLAGALGNIPNSEDQSATEAVDAPSLLERGQWALIVGGIVTIIVSLIGCIGAIRESKVLLIIFGVIVLLCLLLEIVAAAVIILFRSKVDEVLQGFLYDAMDEYHTGLRLGTQQVFEAKTEIERGWDVTQITLECCGVVGYDDWQRPSVPFNATYKGFFCGEDIDNSDPVVPLSCCKATNPHRFPEFIEELYFRNITGCLSSPTIRNAKLRGCYDEILTRMEFYALVLIIVCLAVGLLEVIVVGSAFYLACRNPNIGKGSKYPRDTEDYPKDRDSAKVNDGYDDIQEYDED